MEFLSFLILWSRRGTTCCAWTTFFTGSKQNVVHLLGEPRFEVLRIFNTYGPRMQLDDGRVVSNFIVQALRSQEITVYGDGRQTRSFCYVDDMVQALLRMMESSPEVTGPINVGNPGEFTMLELAETVIRLTESSSRIVHRPLAADDPRQRRPDIRKARSLLGWEPKVRLADGLAETIGYFRSVLGK